MINIPEKYDPLNTEEKITALFEELKSNGCTYSPELEIAILCKIRKAKLQIFLKDLLKQLPRKTHTPSIWANIKGKKKEVVSVENVLVHIPTKNAKSYHIDSNDKKVQEKILKKRAAKEAQAKRQELKSVQKKTFPHFTLKEEVDAYIRGGNIQSIQDAREMLEQAGRLTEDRNVNIYLRRQLNELIDKIKFNHFSGGYEKIKRQQELDREMLDRGPNAKIMYIPAGGQNKRY